MTVVSSLGWTLSSKREKRFLLFKICIRISSNWHLSNSRHKKGNNEKFYQSSNLMKICSFNNSVLKIKYKANKSFRAGMGKVRPAGQIRPTDVFCSACGVVNSTLASYFQCTIRLGFLLCWKKCGPKGKQFFWNGPQTKKIAHP